MKKLLLLLLIAPVIGFGQGEQRYADGTATDQDGNTFEWINYGTQDWAIENAEVVTYRDGTTIPQVTDVTAWSNLTTGAWCYYDNDPSKGKLYNWYSVMGIYDSSSLSDASLRKELAPVGWHVPTEEKQTPASFNGKLYTEWTTLVDYLRANGYNYDGTTTGTKLAKSMASTTGWNSYEGIGIIGNEKSLNNSSGFNAFPVGDRDSNGTFNDEGSTAFFWSSTKNYYDSNIALTLGMSYYYTSLYRYSIEKQTGFPVRFVREASTASTMDYSNTITIYPNPTTSLLTIEGNKEYDIEVYDMAGNKVMALTGNKIDMSHLSSATYIVKALDKVENEEVSYKVVKN
jgi:uncharacterized protein (TIGR02145 family)